MIFTRLHKGNTWRNIMGAGGVYHGTSTKNLEDMTPEEKAEYLKQKQQQRRYEEEQAAAKRRKLYGAIGFLAIAIIVIVIIVVIVSKVS